MNLNLSMPDAKTVPEGKLCLRSLVESVTWANGRFPQVLKVS